MATLTVTLAEYNSEYFQGSTRTSIAIGLLNCYTAIVEQLRNGKLFLRECMLLPLFSSVLRIGVNRCICTCIYNYINIYISLFTIHNTAVETDVAIRMVTDRHTHDKYRNPPAHACRGLKISGIHLIKGDISQKVFIAR